MRADRWLLALLIAAGLSACTQTPPGDQRPAVIVLKIPPYPNTLRISSAPMVAEKNLISGIYTGFDTADTPEQIRTWYSTTLQQTVWTQSITTDENWLSFIDNRECPYAKADIYVSAPTPRITHVRVDYKVWPCRDWPPETRR